MSIETCERLCHGWVRAVSCFIDQYFLYNFHHFEGQGLTETQGFGRNETVQEDIDACIMSTMGSGRASIGMRHENPWVWMKIEPKDDKRRLRKWK